MRISSVRLPRRRLLVVLASVGLVGLVIVSLFLSLTRVQAAGNTYYVALTGNDGNAGTSVGSAFHHIQQCAKVMQAGDTCLIESGTYHETVVPANSGTASAPMTLPRFRGVGEESRSSGGLFKCYGTHIAQG